MATTTMVPPTRSRAQRMEALEEANRVRFARSQIKRDLKAGRVAFGDLLANPPGDVDGMRVVDLLLATPRVGRAKTSELLRRERISAVKTVGGLTDRQRTAIAAWAAARGL